MSITVNNGGVLHTLKNITINNNGTLYPLKTVHSNNNGILYKIFTAEKKSIVLNWNCNDSDYTILSTSENGLTMKFRSWKTDPYGDYTDYTNGVYCQLTIEETTPVHLSIEAIGDYSDKILWINGMGGFNLLEDNTVTFSPGVHYITANGQCDSGYSDFIVEITIL